MTQHITPEQALKIVRKCVQDACRKEGTYDAITVPHAALLPIFQAASAALAQPASEPAQAVPEASKKGCWCTTCRPITFTDSRFVVCPECGNKRCPKAHNHALACTNSNETGQPGSSWESYPPAAPSTGDPTPAPTGEPG
jgi:hypothetical protein